MDDPFYRAIRRHQHVQQNHSFAAGFADQMLGIGRVVTGQFSRGFEVATLRVCRAMQRKRAGEFRITLDQRARESPEAFVLQQRVDMTPVKLAQRCVFRSPVHEQTWRIAQRLGVVRRQILRQRERGVEGRVQGGKQCGTAARHGGQRAVRMTGIYRRPDASVVTALHPRPAAQGA